MADPNLAERARRDAEEARAAEVEYQRTRPPSNIQRQMAAEVGQLLGLELDPRSVRDLGYDGHDYYVAELDVAGVTFVGCYLSDSSIGLHRTSSPFTVYRVRGLFRLRQERQVERLGDLDGWLGVRVTAANG